MMQPSKVRRHATPKRRHYQQSMTGRGLSLNVETIDFIPADCVLKPMRDQMIVQPINVVHSKVLIVPPHQSKLVRGKVLAIGPGHYPLQYLDKDGNKNAPRGKRAKIAAGEVFVPTEVKVGDIVHLDGRNTGKSAFDCFYYGDKYCLHAREADVAGVEDGA
jgi:co-chaperonin GroES (HSP10)